MSETTAFIFLNPQWLLLLPLSWILLWFFDKYFKRPSIWNKVCEARFLQALIPIASETKGGHWLVWVLALVFTLGIISLAGPSWQKQNTPLLESAAARVVVLDLSRSMLVEDVKPGRLDKALESARHIISSGFDGDTGLVVFAGYAFVVSPLTRDKTSLLEFLGALKPGIMPIDGSRVDLAIAKAQQLLLSSITGTGHIILISDGAGDPQQSVIAAFEANKQGHRVSVVAIGSSQGGPLKNENGGLLRDESGKPVLAKTDFKLLKTIAEAGKGRFLKLSDSDINNAFLLDNLESKEFVFAQEPDNEVQRKRANGGIWLVWLMLPFTLLLFRKNAFWLLLIFLMVPDQNEVRAAELNSLWRNPEQLAFDAYQRGDYQHVIKISENAMLRSYAWFQLQEYQQALDSLTDESSARSYYNRANILVYLKKYTEALVAYARVLEINPGFADAAYNQGLVEAYLAQEIEMKGNQSNEAETQEEVNDLSNESSFQSRLSGQDQSEGNQTESGVAGIGAGSLQIAPRPEEDELFDGAEAILEQLVSQTQEANSTPDPALVKLWTQSLLADPSELFRRKFLRDYRRNNIKMR